MWLLYQQYHISTTASFFHSYSNFVSVGDFDLLLRWVSPKILQIVDHLPPSVLPDLSNDAFSLHFWLSLPDDVPSASDRYFHNPLYNKNIPALISRMEVHVGMYLLYHPKWYNIIFPVDGRHLRFHAQDRTLWPWNWGVIQKMEYAGKLWSGIWRLFNFNRIENTIML